MPPSTRKVDAVMKLDSSEARKSTAPRRALLVGCEQLAQQRGVDRAGAEGVHAHALSRELHPQLARHRQHPALACAVGDLRGGGPHHGDERRRVDDRALALFEHVRQGGLAAQVDRGEVDLLHSAPGVELGVEDGVVVGWADAGVVEGDIDRPELVLGGHEQGVDVSLAHDVAAYEASSDLVGDPRPVRLVEVADDDLGPLLRKPSNGGQADARAPSGDHRDLALEPASAVTCHVNLLSGL